MPNIVDTSAETVKAEFDAAEQDIGTEESQQENDQASQEQARLEEEQKQAEIAMATGMIATSLKFSLSSFSGVTVEDTLTNQAAESYAMLIIKYFPGGLFALLNQYKEEFTAITATFILIKAVSEAKAEKTKEEEAKKMIEAKNKKPEVKATAGLGEQTNG